MENGIDGEMPWYSNSNPVIIEWQTFQKQHQFEANSALGIRMFYVQTKAKFTDRKSVYGVCIHGQTTGHVVMALSICL